jgi:hypothetical protein
VENNCVGFSLVLSLQMLEITLTVNLEKSIKSMNSQTAERKDAQLLPYISQHRQARFTHLSCVQVWPWCREPGNSRFEGVTGKRRVGDNPRK